MPPSNLLPAEADLEKAQSAGKPAFALSDFFKNNPNWASQITQAFQNSTRVTAPHKPQAHPATAQK